jgi:peptidoglycan-associated lipoprotein
MWRKSIIMIVLFLCVGLILSGCPKKTVVKDDASARKAEELAAQKERERLEAEKKAQEEARLKEEEAKREAARQEAAKREFEKSLQAKKTPGIEGEVFESGLLKDIYFEFDRYDVRPQDADILKQNAAWLTKSPNAKIQIEGHCDERGTSEYNLALGERRANSTKKYLISLGVKADRISTITYGKERPLDPAHTEEAWAKNRRAHSIVLSK